MEKKCKICGKEVGIEYGRLKKGLICQSCMHKVSIGVRSSLKDFTADQIKHIINTIQPYQKEKNVWCYCGTLKVCFDRIIINGFEYPLKNLVAVKLNFHPKELGRLPDTAVGVITVMVEIKEPHYLIEEAFIAGKTTAQYIISGMDIIYHYSDDLEHVIKAVQNSIQDGTYIIKEAIQDAQKQKEEKKEEKTKKTYRWEKGKTAQKKEEPLTPLEAAMKLLSVERPFTKADLRKKRNQYLAENHVHPDDGGSEEAFRKIQDAYELLLKFAAD